MILGREETVSALFRETDRAQRMKMPLTLIKFGVVGWEARNNPDDLSFDAELEETIGRITPLLRCYDAVGQMADREFLIILPGCSGLNATPLAERLRDEVFASSPADCATKTRFQVCFGVASSGGRSPFVVLREVDEVLRIARSEGAGTVQCVAAMAEIDLAVVLSPTQQDEALHW